MRKGYFILGLIYLLLFWSCRKPYEPAVIKEDYNYLVIDGVINAGANAVTTISLSRTKNLTDSISAKPELGAQVVIEAQSGGSIALNSQGNGLYRSQPLNLNVTGNYRLKITTSNGSVYQSDYVGVKQTPPIDSLSWKQDSVYKDVTIYAHAHDPQNNTRYYRWSFVETWQYQAAISASWGVSNGLAYFINPYDSLIQQYNCWGTINSSTIATANTEALSQDVVSYAVVNKVPHNAEKMMVRYSIDVQQYGLTKEAYQYWQIIEKSSQQTGTIFDPMPSQVLGNIHCVTNPAEPVIGYASVSFVTSKRMFIDHSELNDWFYKAPGVICVEVSTFQNPVDFRIYDYPDTTLSISYYVTGGGLVLTKKDCLDCRRRGGTNLKPSFWR
jgi:hypothetical protein